MALTLEAEGGTLYRVVAEIVGPFGRIKQASEPMGIDAALSEMAAVRLWQDRECQPVIQSVGLRAA